MAVERGFSPSAQVRAGSAVSLVRSAMTALVVGEENLATQGD
jgi:hypothetical protein